MFQERRAYFATAKSKLRELQIIRISPIRTYWYTAPLQGVFFPPSEKQSSNRAISDVFICRATTHSTGATRGSFLEPPLRRCRRVNKAGRCGVWIGSFGLSLQRPHRRVGPCRPNRDRNDLNYDPQQWPVIQRNPVKSSRIRGRFREYVHSEAGTAYPSIVLRVVKPKCRPR